MQASDLVIFNAMPVLFWVRDSNHTYLWANNAMKEAADNDVVGLTDDDMPWSNYKKEFERSDRLVFDSGETYFSNSMVINNEEAGEQAKIVMCKWLDDFEGKDCVYGMTLIEEFKA